jgi:hypothetical protein
MPGPGGKANPVTVKLRAQVNQRIGIDGCAHSPVTSRTWLRRVTDTAVAASRGFCFRYADGILICGRYSGLNRTTIAGSAEMVSPSPNAPAPVSS